MKVYQYLAKPPITDAAAIERQLRLAVEYQRALTETEVRHRKAVEQVYIDALLKEYAACMEAEKAFNAAVLKLRCARSYGEDAHADVKAATTDVSAAREIMEAAWEAKRVARDGVTGKWVCSEEAPPTDEDVQTRLAVFIDGVWKKSTPNKKTKKRPKWWSPEMIEHPQWREINPKIVAFDAVARAEKKVAYNAPEFEDLIWGTKIAIDESAERAAQASAKAGSLPKLPTFDGSGAIVVQLQGKWVTGSREGFKSREAIRVRSKWSKTEVAEDGTRWILDAEDRRVARTEAKPVTQYWYEATVADLADDTRFRLEMLDFATWMKRRGKSLTRNDGRPLPAPKESNGQYAIAHLRIASDANRDPVWASWPVRISRPLPANGMIKWVKMHASKVGTRVEWKLQITIDEPAVTKRSGGKTLAVNLGWRNLEHGCIRVAYAVGSDGREEEVLVPERFLKKLEHVESIRSIRDRLCDTAHSMLRGWITDLTTCDEPEDRDTLLPEWFIEAVRYMSNWRGPKQLAKLLREWETQRFAGDETIFAALSMWRNGKTEEGHSVGNHHLRFWESDEREKAYNHRNEVYRQIALRWAREYSRIIVTDMDLRDFAEESAPEDGPRSEGSLQRRTRTLASPSILRGEIKHACSSHGSEYEEKKMAATQICVACGVRLRFDAKHQLVRTCGACGAIDDQDRNHCKVLLASASVARDRAGALAPSVNAEKKEASAQKGRWGKRRSQSATQTSETLQK